jgi:uncharacterized membrane protein YeaQ/YmgE (transglycosylase-associated protein family)
LLGLFLLIAIGLVVGWLADFMTHGGRLGTTGNIIVGIIGSILGGLLFQQFGAMLVGEGPVVPASFGAAFVGAVILVIIAGLIKR